MSRSMYRTTLNCPVEEANSRIENLLRNRNYHVEQRVNETVWKEGVGLATAMHYIKIQYPSDREIQVSGWIQAGIGSATLNEINLHGSVLGVIPKKQVKRVLADIFAAVSSDPEILSQPDRYINLHDNDVLPDIPVYEDALLSGGTAQPEPLPAAEEAPAGMIRDNSAEYAVFCPQCGHKITVPAGHPNPFIFCDKCGYRLTL